MVDDDGGDNTLQGDGQLLFCVLFRTRYLRDFAKLYCGSSLKTCLMMVTISWKPGLQSHLFKNVKFYLKLAHRGSRGIALLFL